ncbi:hypothetical protein SGRA_3178 [Saprospira grandis str. Lewin]|uniref:Uncharacterized protein n=1 Tax=Saprospira grandis (strain Lewin) TaxID=984262 RepID=H6L0V0_SAPGL|nr:hypothetical protein SGRA_3178 [Saprospira grandis str. Lewin]
MAAFGKAPFFQDREKGALLLAFLLLILSSVKYKQKLAGHSSKGKTLAFLCCHQTKLLLQ